MVSQAALSGSSRWKGGDATGTDEAAEGAASWGESFGEFPGLRGVMGQQICATLQGLIWKDFSLMQVQVEQCSLHHRNPNCPNCPPQSYTSKITAYNMQ